MTEVRSTNSDSWAQVYIEGAKEKGFLPEHLQCNYTENITRAEFASILVRFIEAYSKKSIDSILWENQLPLMSVPFDDALFIDVDYVYRLGIAQGRTGKTYDPLANITREEAAVMMTRMLNILGKDTSAYNYNLPAISEWAVDSVNFVYEKGIMQGTDDGFDPRGNITKQQYITALYRIYYNVK